MKKPNLRIIGIEEDEESQGPENIFNKIIEENFSNLNEEMFIHIKEAYRTPTVLDQKWKSSYHIVIKTQIYTTKKTEIEKSR